MDKGREEKEELVTGNQAYWCVEKGGYDNRFICVLLQPQPGQRYRPHLPRLFDSYRVFQT